MKLVLTIEIEVTDINKKGEVYDKLIASDRVVNFVEQHCGYGCVTDITLQDNDES